MKRNKKQPPQNWKTRNNHDPILFLSILPLIFLLAYPLVDPHWLVMDGIYFHDNTWQLHDSFIFYVLASVSLCMIGITSVSYKSWRSMSFPVVALVINGILGLYSPFVSVAFVLGLSDSIIVLHMIISSYNLGKNL